MNATPKHNLKIQKHEHSSCHALMFKYYDNFSKVNINIYMQSERTIKYQ